MMKRGSRISTMFLACVTLVACSGPLLAQSSNTIANVHLGSGDICKLVNSIQQLNLKDTKHQKFEAKSFRGATVRGDEVHFKFDARYRNYQDVPIPKMKKIEKKVFGKRIVVEVPDGVRMELRKLLDVSGTIDAKLVLKQNGDKVELAFEIVNIPIKGLPGELQRLIVSEVKKKVDRTLLSESTYLPAYDARVAVSMAKPIGSSTSLETKPATLLHVFEQALKSNPSALKKHKLQLKTDPKTKKNWLIVDSKQLMQGNGKKDVSFEDGRLSFPTIEIRNELIVLKAQLSCKKLIYDSQEYGGGTVDFHLPVKFLRYGSSEYGFELAEDARDIDFLESDSPLIDMLSQTLNVEYGPTLVSLLKTIRIKKSDLAIKLPEGLPTSLTRLENTNISLEKELVRLEYELR